MKIGLTSDLHYGFDTDYTAMILKRFFDMISKKNLGTLVIAGDWASTDTSELKNVITLIRGILPDLPIVGVWGNHDLWQYRAYYKNYRNPMDIESLLIDIDSFAERHDITIFNGYNEKIVDGIHFMGWGGWYCVPSPLINDPHWMPRYTDDTITFDFLRKRSWAQFDKMLAILEYQQVHTPRQSIIVTHFTHPELTTKPYYHFCGESMHFRMLESLAIKPVVMYGHSHRKKLEKHNEILYLNSGSDYSMPKLLIYDTDTGEVEDVGFPYCFSCPMDENDEESRTTSNGE